MSRMNRILIATTGLLLAGSALAEAQVIVRERSPVVVVQEQRGWLGFSYRVNVVREDGRVVERPIVITEVVEESPAERAGLRAGDTLVSINDMRVTSDLMNSLVQTLEPGDEVRVRVSRDGRERTLAIVAAERPEEYAIRRLPDEDVFIDINPDEIRDRIRIYLDSARVVLDSVKIPHLRIERTPEGMYMYTDTGRVLVMPRDSLWRRNFRNMYVWSDSLQNMFQYRFPRDSMRFKFDSAFVRVMPDMRALAWSTDSLRARFDSLRWSGAWITGNDPNVWLATPGRGITIVGSRAIAGAELTELNPSLGEYFGTEEGVLVVRVPDDTPAAEAGLLAGDVIVAVNGAAVDDVSSLRRRISRVQPGDPIRLEVVRKNQRRTIELKDD